MEVDIENTETTTEEGPKPKKRKRLIIPWKLLALYILPAVIVFIIFIVMHNSLVQPPLSREEIMALMDDRNKEAHSEGDSDQESDPVVVALPRLRLLALVCDAGRHPRWLHVRHGHHTR